MALKFTLSDGVGLMAVNSVLTGSEMQNGILTLPETLGKGYIKTIDLGHLMKIMIHQYELVKDVIFKRTALKPGKDIITFSFRNILQQHSTIQKNLFLSGQNAMLLPSVQVTSADMYFEMFTPCGTIINAIIIHVHIDLLKDLLNQKEGNTLFQNIIWGNKPYLYEEIISPEIQDVAARIVKASVPEELTDYYLKIKAEELICLFFVEFLKRRHIPSYPLNVSDLKMIYSVRNKIISDLCIPPNITGLARFSGMSESKMNRLFKQIFGNSIYSYYQMLRMNEAAHLIKEEKLSVSEVGYRLGFTNLSHFTRIFEKHIGNKPKKYSLK